MIGAKAGIWLLAFATLACSACPEVPAARPKLAESTMQSQLEDAQPAPRRGRPVEVQSGPEPGVPRAVVRHRNYRIEFGPYALEVDPADGGRIVEFSLGGRSAVIPRRESSTAYGSSFWPSPQSDWQWPPPPELNSAAWDVSVDASRLLLESGTNAKLGLSARQVMHADLERELVVLDHQLVNRGNAPRKVAPWQNTRVRPRGLTFFPSDSPTLPPSALELKPVDGVIWFAHDPAAVTENQKAFADGREGWLAHVDGDLLFLKVFPDVPRDAQAPGEAEIEIYVDQGGTVQRLLKSARSKVAGCLVAGRALHIRQGEEDAHLRSHGD